MKQIDLILWLKCNEKCSFCFQDSEYIKSYDKQLNKEDILKILLKWKFNNINTVNISWWEPTVYENNFNYVLKLSKKLLFKNIKVTTNWIKFADEEFTKKNIKYLTDIWLSFHCSERHIQDKLTWLKWSYDLVIKAINNIRAYGNVNLHNHCVITKENMDYLEDHIKNLISLKFDTIHIMSLMHNTNINKLQTYNFNKLSELLKTLIDKYNSFLRIEISYLQPCYMEWYEKYIIWFEYWKKYLSNNEKSLLAWKKTIVENKYITDNCKQCWYLNECYWFWKI